MRPESHREQVPEKRCGNCQHCRLIPIKNDHLCFRNDSIEMCPDGTDYVYLDGVDVSFMYGDEYSKVWGGRVVDPLIEICDEWEARS